jgi:hypothetical protein
MTDARSAFDFAGTELVADPSGALYWPAEETLVVSDLHFEKGSAYARRGIFLPPYDTRATLKALGAAAAHYKPRRVISLGDSFHDAWGSERIAPRDREMLGELMDGREWIWVLGNHDPAPPRDLGGESVGEITLGPITFRHEPIPGAVGEVAGHLHPCATVGAKGRRLRRRCFAFDGSRLVMPAFGAYTGGLCVLDRAFALVLRAPFLALVLGRNRVYPISHTKLLPDAA